LSVFLFIFFSFLFFNDTATSDIYTLSLHDALPIYSIFPWQHFAGLQCCYYPESVISSLRVFFERCLNCKMSVNKISPDVLVGQRSEEHTSELQSRSDLVCRLLLEKKKKTNKN